MIPTDLEDVEVLRRTLITLEQRDITLPGKLMPVEMLSKTATLEEVIKRVNQIANSLNILFVEINDNAIHKQRGGL